MIGPVDDGGQRCRFVALRIEGVVHRHGAGDAAHVDIAADRPFVDALVELAVDRGLDVLVGGILHPVGNAGILRILHHIQQRVHQHGKLVVEALDVGDEAVRGILYLAVEQIQLVRDIPQRVIERVGGGVRLRAELRQVQRVLRVEIIQKRARVVDRPAHALRRGAGILQRGVQLRQRAVGGLRRGCDMLRTPAEIVRHASFIAAAPVGDRVHASLHLAQRFAQAGLVVLPGGDQLVQLGLPGGKVREGSIENRRGGVQVLHRRGQIAGDVAAFQHGDSALQRVQRGGHALRGRDQVPGDLRQQRKRAAQGSALPVDLPDGVVVADGKQPAQILGPPARCVHAAAEEIQTRRNGGRDAGGVVGGLVDHFAQVLQLQTDRLQGAVGQVQYNIGLRDARDTPHVLAAVDRAVVDAAGDVAGGAARDAAHVVADVLIPHGAVVAAGGQHAVGPAHNTAAVGCDIVGVWAGKAAEAFLQIEVEIREGNGRVE